MLKIGIFWEIVFSIINFIMALGVWSRFNGGHIFTRSYVDSNGDSHPFKISLFGCAGLTGWVAAAIYTAILVSGWICMKPIIASEAYRWGAPIVLVFMLAELVAPPIVYRHMVNEEDGFGDEWKAILPIVIMEVPVFLTALSAAYATTALWGSTVRVEAVFTDVVTKLPWILLPILVVFLITSYLMYIYDRDNDPNATEEEQKNAKACRVVSIILWVLAAIAVALIILFGIILDNTGKDNKPADPQQQEEQEPEETNQEAWAKWYCLDSKTKVDEFGPNPFEKSWVKNPEKAWAALKKDSLSDPLIGISAIYYNDSITGNRYMLDFYNKYKDDTDAINAAIYYYNTGSNRVDDGQYKSMAEEVFEWIEDHDPTYEVLTAKQLKERGIRVSDQLYANKKSHTYDETKFEIPNAIVYDCGQGSSSDYYLVVTYKIKNRKVTEIWHINCRWQPCNVSKVMRVKVKPNPNKEEETTTQPETEPETKKPKPEPEPDTVKPKDTSKGITDPGNDNRKSSGPDTNNGVGAQHSKVENPNSSSNPAVNYSKIQNDIKKENNNQQKASSGNPSTNTGADNIDNAGAGGAANQGKTVIPAESGVQDNPNDYQGEWY